MRTVVYPENWNEDCWPLLMQAVMRRPRGVKPVYARVMVDLAFELHVPPSGLRALAEALVARDLPSMARLWARYAGNPRRLRRDAKLARDKRGFGREAAFYDGVEYVGTFERDFMPLPQAPELTPAMLILALDLYFRLTPLTMVAATPDVAALARLIGRTPQAVVEVMEVFLFLDPQLNRSDLLINPLLAPCQDVWRRFATGEPDAPNRLAAMAGELRAYFD